jgi:hypothetical protein
MKGGAFLVGKTFLVLCCVVVFFTPPITQHFHILGTHAQLGLNSLKSVIITSNKTKNIMKQKTFPWHVLQQNPMLNIEQK